MTVLSSGWATHVGRVRHDNEDAAYSGRRVWAVADGMGGHVAGEVASRLAVEAMAALDDHDGPLDSTTIVAAVEGANEAILRHAATDHRARGLGTTLVGVAETGESASRRLCIFNVGDSRAYRLVGSRLLRITIDHSEVEELVADGLITPAQARNHPLRNVVTRCLGMPLTPEVDTFDIKPFTGKLVLCSDGLSGELTDAAMARIVAAAPDPQQAADGLVAAAVDAGGSDNVTVVVLDVGSSS